jgi:PKD repeat protein
LALYTFEEGTGNTIFDSSGTGLPLNLNIQSPQNTEWLQCGGLAVTKSSLIAADTLPTKITDAVKDSNAITIEAWLLPANESQEGPARIVTLSDGAFDRNFTLSQTNSEFEVRLRTSTAGKNGISPSTTTNGHQAKTKLTHVLYSRDAAGQATIYVNGDVVATQTIPGNSASWSDAFNFGLANEFGIDRPWLGEFYLVSVYQRALQPLEVQQNYTAGIQGPCNKPPSAKFVKDTKTGYLPLPVNFDASASHDLDGVIVNYQWDFGDGSTATGVQANHTFATAGVYTVTLTVTDDAGDSAQHSQKIQAFSASDPQRMALNQIALYTFAEQNGPVVYDLSGTGAALNLGIQDPLNTNWLQCGGLSVNDSTIINALGSPYKITEAAKATNEISIEAWVVAESDGQDGPARIVTLSNGAFDRNFTLSQKGSEYDVRLRTSSTGLNADIPSTTTTEQQVNTSLTHVLYTRDSQGQATIYIDGQAAGTQLVTGDFQSWDDNFQFGLANEFGIDRTWLGEYYLVSVYDVALTNEQVLQNYHAGIQTPCNKIPTAKFFADENFSEAPLIVNVDASQSLDLDGGIVAYQWNFGDGTSATGKLANHTYNNPGVYVITLTVFDNNGGASQFSQVVQAVSSGVPDRIVLGELAHYNFLEGTGTIITDRSGTNPPLNLIINDPSHTTWLQCGGLSVDQSTLIAALDTPYKISDAIKLSNAITVEAWIAPDNLSQDGPARIVTLSDGSYERNVTLGQVQGNYDVRLRTTVTGENGTNITTKAGPVVSALQHVIYTRDYDGNAKLYIDGQLRIEEIISGHTLNWSDGFQFGLANEFGATRSWLGDLHLVSVYDRALGAEEVLQNYGAGLVDSCVVNNDPVINSTPPTATAVNTLFQYQVTASDIDGDLLNFQLVNPPAGMTIHSIGGLVSWQPNILGYYDITVNVTDIRGGQTNQQFTLQVQSTSGDQDGDGVPDDVDAFPNDPTEWSDLDGDGIGDNSDTDRDGDGFENNDDAFPNDPNEWSDLDGDGIGDNEDPDRDDDGVLDDEDLFPNDPTEWLDTDGDGIGNNADNDDDNDGVLDTDDDLPLDPNESVDTDGDGIGNNADPDDDNDGVLDADDIFPFDPNESADYDEDGIGNNADPDDDNDGVEDTADAFPFDPAESADTDGDGTGDNTDPDIDGDGVSNEDEIAAGTDPFNGQDYPDTTAPQLIVNQASPVQTSEEFITLTGTVIDPPQPNSGLAFVHVASDRFAGTTFAALLDGDNFSVQVPLKIGVNKLQVLASDFTGNNSGKNVDVARLSPPRFFNITPQDGSVVTEERITIAGQVQASLPLSQMQFFVNEYQITPTGTGESGTYDFSLPNIPVVLGNNVFVLRAVNPDGTVQQTLNLTYTPEDADNIAAPKITLLTPANNSQLNVDSFRTAFRVESFAGSLSVTFNGSPVTISPANLTIVDFSEIVSFPAGADEVTVTVAASDSLQKSSAFSAQFFRDSQEPIIIANGGLQVSPTVNEISQSSYTFSGTVIDNNLASVLINNQSVRLSPGVNSQSYDFAVTAPITAGQTQTINIRAADLGGNVTNAEYILQNISTVEVNPVLPPVNSEFLSSGSPIDVQVVARVSQLVNGETVQVRIDNNQGQSLMLVSTLATGTIQLPSDSGSYTLFFDILNNLNEVIATAQRSVSVLNEADVPVELVRVEPENNTQFIEPNKAIELYFNRAVDLSLLQISVRETLNGLTYINDDALGLDFIQAEGYKLKEVNRNLEQVPGALSVIPGGTGISFNPSRMYGFDADIFLEVTYDGELQTRTSFKVRELPTFILGSVTDQFGQPLARIDVAIPELDRTSITNGDGGFAFGFQESSDKIIPGGRYTMLVNDGMSNPTFGSRRLTVNVQRNRKNTVAAVSITEIAKDEPFQNVSSGQVLSLAGGDLVVDLQARNAQLLFAQGRTIGAIHTQFLPFEHIGTRIMPTAMPQWIYGQQPQGVLVEGEANLSIKIPELSGSLNYIVGVFEHVVIVSYNPELGVIEPVGVGKVNEYRVDSVRPVELKSMDYIGYAFVDPANNELLAAFANGDKSLQQLKAELK